MVGGFFFSAIVWIFQPRYFVTKNFLVNVFIHHWELGFYMKEKLDIFLRKFVFCQSHIRQFSDSK